MFNTWMGKIRSIMGQANNRPREEGTNVDQVYETHIGAGWEFLDTDIDGAGTTEEAQTTEMSASSGTGPYNPSDDGVEIKSHPFLSSSADFGEEKREVASGVPTCAAPDMGVGESGMDIEPHAFLAAGGDRGEKAEGNIKFSECSLKDAKTISVDIPVHAFLSTKLEGSGDAKTVDEKSLAKQTELGSGKELYISKPHPPNKEQQIMSTTEKLHPPTKEQPIMSTPEEKPHPPTKQQPIGSTPEKPHPPTKEQPIMSTTEKPHPPTKQQPIGSTTEKPHPPTKEQPIMSTTEKPHPPTKQQPIGSTTEKPHPPTKEQPIMSTTEKPHPPTKQQPIMTITKKPHPTTKEQPIMTTTEKPHPQDMGGEIGKTPNEDVAMETGETSVDVGEDGQADKAKKSTDKKKQGKKLKVCKYIRIGQDCWYGDKCIYSHDVGLGRSHTREGKGPSPPTTERDKPQLPAPVPPKGPEGYLPYVAQMSAAQRIIGARDFFYKLGFLSGVPKVELETAVIGQYKMAAARQNIPWVREARYYAEILFPDTWIDKNLPSLDQRSQRRNKKNKHVADKQNKVFEAPGGLCRDIRLKDNPELEIVHAEITPKTTDPAVTKAAENVAEVKCNGEAVPGLPEKPLDNFVTDYTSSLIEKAVKLAISEGLSESAIMEVIDDVTTVADTPRKKTKPTPVDTSRTPRKQPDQLAIGFNYHSDLVVKESPKTVCGGIIPIDESKTPRERAEKLALGFNYHSDVIMKNSPKPANGEVPKLHTNGTPRRLARDQLAIGFNYHSDLIVKDSPHVNTDDSLEIDAKMCNGAADTSPQKNKLANNQVETPKSTKRSKNDTVAIGFSYNSEIMKQSLLKMNGDATADVVCVSEEVKESEDRNLIEMTDESLPVGNLPAGSVW